MANRDFIENRNISEDNCFLELMQIMDANFENEISLVEHSPYYIDDDFRSTVDRVSGSLRILNLNCGGLNAKLDKLKIFLAECNNNFRPISVIALQETHLTNDSDIYSFQLSDYNFVYDLARINSLMMSHFMFTNLSVLKDCQQMNLIKLRQYMKACSWRYIVMRINTKNILLVTCIEGHQGCLQICHSS